MRRRLLWGPWIIVRDSTIPRGAPDTISAHPCSLSWLQILTLPTKNECKPTCSHSNILVSLPTPKVTCIQTSSATTPSTSQTSTTSTIQWLAARSPPVLLHLKERTTLWIRPSISTPTTSMITRWAFTTWCRVISWIRCLPTHKCFKGFRLLITSMTT